MAEDVLSPTKSIRIEELRGMPDVHIDKIDSSVNEAGKDDGAFSRLFDNLFRRHRSAQDRAESNKKQGESDRSLGGPGRPPA